MTDINKLKVLKEKIEGLENPEHQEILKIIKKNSCKFTENNNGIFVNMNKLKGEVIEEIETFLNFSEKNNAMLTQREQILCLNN